MPDETTRTPERPAAPLPARPPIVERPSIEALGSVDYAEAMSTRTPARALEIPAAPRTWRDAAIVQLTLVRFREFLREPEAVFWSFVFPILLAAGLGIAFRHRPPDRLAVAVAEGRTGTDEIGDAIGVASADALAKALARDSALLVRQLSDSAAALALRTGEVALVVAPAAHGGVEYRFDPTRPEGRTARLLVDARVQAAAGRTDPVPTAQQEVRERGSRYIDFFVPGLLGMNLMGSGIWGVGFAIVTARNKKLLKRLVATPMSRAQYLLSFLLSRLLFLVVEATAILGFGVLVFKVPMRGPLVVVATICFLAALAFSGLGLLIASRAQTTEGVSGLMNLAMLPMWIFSGVFFSASNFPAATQPFIRALPLTAVNDALRATMLQGAGLAAVVPQLAVIGAWLVATVVLALWLFRWR